MAGRIRGRACVRPASYLHCCQLIRIWSEQESGSCVIAYTRIMLSAWTLDHAPCSTSWLFGSDMGSE